jgi:hypothetical protein
MTLEMKHATEFVIGMKWDDEDKSRWVTILRRTNHGNLIPDGKWAACIVLGPMNPWYLGADYVWRYKTYTVFETAEAAYQAARHSHSIARSYDLQEKSE